MVEQAIQEHPEVVEVAGWFSPNPGGVGPMTRAMLLEEVWNYKFVPQTNLVDVHMGRLRRKVDEPHEPPMIHNVRGVGFILRAPA